ncbi:MAG: hypothetical protein DRI61_10360 [Chloroflexi bacterium]|nr:MAG: hypothetical protein DRI61_10360 [Chloroflexota bacterium]
MDDDDDYDDFYDSSSDTDDECSDDHHFVTGRKLTGGVIRPGQRRREGHEIVLYIPWKGQFTHGEIGRAARREGLRAAYGYSVKVHAFARGQYRTRNYWRIVCHDPILRIQTRPLF